MSASAIHVDHLYCATCSPCRITNPTRGNVTGHLTRFIPFRIRNATSSIIHKYSFPRALRRIASLAPTQIPNRDLLESFRAGWENESWCARTDYLEEVVKWAAVTPGPILECGSGITTILLGLVAGRRGIPIWSLEHDVNWYERMTSLLHEHRIPGVEICLAPLRNYEKYFWYDPPLDRMPASFRLVVCDGPPQLSTPGERYGLLPVMRDHLGSNTTILLDDTGAEDSVLLRWLAERAATPKFFKDEASHSFASIVLD